MAAKRRKPKRTPSALVDDVTKTPTFAQQIQRIGGNLTPLQVSSILTTADAGQPARLVDLFHESRQKNGHLQSIAQSRELAVASLPMLVWTDENASATTKKAAKFASDVVRELEQLPIATAHLAGEGAAFGYSYVQARWRKLGRYLIPDQLDNVHCRRFYYDQHDGRLLFSDTGSDGISLEEFRPGKFVWYRPRINGDVPAREGLARVSVWFALFQNWGWRDFLELAELAWKPKRIGKYWRGGQETPPRKADDEDIKQLKRTLERLITAGDGWIPDNTDIALHWPTGVGKGGAHEALLGLTGDELTKAWLGVADVVDAGESGSRAALEVRDRLRNIIWKHEAASISLRWQEQLIRPMCAMNFGPNLDPIYFKLDTSERPPITEFASAVKALRESGMRIPEQYVRDNMQPNIPEIKAGDVVLGEAPEESNDDNDSDRVPSEDPDDDES
jgi:phage gp29-like protein